MHGTLGACVSFLIHPFMLPFGNGTLNDMFINHAFAQHDIPCCFDVQLQSLPMSFVKHTQHAHKSDP